MIENKTGIIYLIDFGNSVRLTLEEIKKKINPYHLVINDCPFNLLNDF